MTIPASLTNQLALVQAAYTAAQPIESSPPLLFADLDNKTWTLVQMIDGQVSDVGVLIDQWAAGNNALQMAANVTSLAQEANDELDAYEMRSHIGRFVANMELVQGWGRYFVTSTPLEIIGIGTEPTVDVYTAISGDPVSGARRP